MKKYIDHGPGLDPSRMGGFSPLSPAFGRKAATAFALAAFLSGALLATNLHGQSATRTLPATYSPGESIEVTIQANPGSSDVWGLEEFVPDGWNVTNIRINGEAASSAQAGYVASTNAVNFGLFFDSQARTFAYTAHAPASATGSVAFGGGGAANIAGNTGTATVGGDSMVSAGDPVDPAGPPTIVQHPQNVDVEFGGTASFTVTAESASDVQYQWRRNGADIAGATNASLTIANATAADAGEYSVAVTNEHGTTVSNTAVLSVEVPDLTPVELADLTIGPGNPLLSASRIYNLAANLDYSVDIDGASNNVAVTIDHNHRGRLTGSGQVNGEDAEVHGTIRRFGTASDPLHRVNLTVRVPGTDIALDHTLDIDAAGNQLTGNVRQRGSADAQSVSISLPGEIDGDWSLDIATDAQGEGTATLNLKDEQVVYDVVARQSAAHNNRTILTLSPADANGGGSLRVDLDQNNEVVLVMGRAKGQSVNAR